ncbi:7615_t:CDS:2 [Diversispora eburnea]|uniref:7615_t:CDS:1 n=1 Tax=Diversispora eburnea TaxID=1213867 RepID=A0A9N8ZSW7_9GLOM|nr:7615_t:CDS:2 [Diversispora eburnea]
MYEFKPSLKEVQEIVTENKGNTIPIFTQIPADLLTPVGAYLRISEKSQYSFLLESVAGGEKIGRYSFLGSDPYKVIKTGDHEPIKGDPLMALEEELSSVKFFPVPGIPKFTVSHYRSDSTDLNNVEYLYNLAIGKIKNILKLLRKEVTPAVPQGEIRLNQTSVSNVGKAGYEGFVTTLKQHIKKGDIIQAVPSQRLSRETTLHPFNVYRYLRMVNPSPYLFYVDLKDHQIVGASPELLVKVEDEMVYTHPIAGTRKRGKTAEEDEKLADDLLSDPKERAEHIMLVDLGRNDVNRVCQPKTVKVDSLMKIEKYSHVMHIVSQVSGKLRPDKTRYDAFRSIFPAGTVSGAPKVRAMELIGELEKEKRGVYAGAVGHFDFSNSIDTCIAIRTMLFKDGIAYLQAGFVEEDEYQESINKLKSNVTCIDQAEDYYLKLQKN